MARQKLKGSLFLFIFTAILYFGSTFFLPSFLLLLLLPWGLQLSDRVHNLLAGSFFNLLPALLEMVFGMKTKICGDMKKLSGPCFLIMNHRTRFDWLFLFCYLIRMGDLRNLKIVLKESLRAMPVLGWSMQSLRFIFLSRKWNVDEKRMKDGISYFVREGFPLQLLFFPEGTDLSPSNKEKGHHYAEKNKLQKYDFVLHPRTKGFTLCVEELRKFREPVTIVNVSVGYVGPMPQNERDIADGVWPTEIHFLARQEPLAALPSDEQGLVQWLDARWKEKEKELKEFYRHKKFSAAYVSDGVMKEAFVEMKKVMFIWSAFSLYIGYNLATNSFYWYYFPIFTTLYMLLHYTLGVNRIFRKRENLFKKTQHGISSNNTSNSSNVH